MRPDDNEGKTSRIAACKYSYRDMGITCLLLLFGLSACREQSATPESSSPSPPDLSRCTRIEVACPPVMAPSTMPALFDADFFSATEAKRLQSPVNLVVDDQKSIKTLAQEVSSGWTYSGFSDKATPPPIGKSTRSYSCYRNDARVAVVSFYGPQIIMTEDGHWFQYDEDLPDFLSSRPQEGTPLLTRFWCGLNLLTLHEELLQFVKNTKAYPLRFIWCEMVVRNRMARNEIVGSGQKSEISEEEVRSFFRCPAAGEGKSHYALNDTCRSASAPDMVLLFESRAGWNQHGGPELFTFDNHDPKGGCVLLNDGTVKFIRTEEELQQLRWK